MKHLFLKLNKNFIFMMSLFILITAISSCKDDDDPIDPVVDLSTVVADFTAQVDADNSFTYNFTNNSVVNGITDTSFDSSWDFGGDGTSTEESPSHTFTAEGTYDVVLTVTASDGVVESSTETIVVTEPINLYAVITDLTSDDTGELRLGLDSIQTGRVTYTYRVAEGPNDMDIQDAFINVTGTSTSGKNSIVEVRLKDDANHEFREGASDATIAAADFPEGSANTWTTVEVSWNADGTNTPTYTVVIGGTTVITDAPSTTRDPNDADMVAEHLETTIDGAHNFQWKYNSTSNVSDGLYHVDDIVIYSSDSGSEVVIFEDNFQGRTVGYDLSPVVNMDSPYHENTFDAVVGQD